MGERERERARWLNLEQRRTLSQDYFRLVYFRWCNNLLLMRRS